MGDQQVRGHRRDGRGGQARQQGQDRRRGYLYPDPAQARLRHHHPQVAGPDVRCLLRPHEGLRRGPAVRRPVPRALRRRPHRVPQDRAEPPDRQPRGRGVLRFPRAQDGGAGPNRVPAPLRVAGPRLHPRPHGRQGPRRPHASRPGRRPGEQQGRYPGTGDRKAG